ncbi:MAG: hypothetical protein QXQ14_00115 [Candidatus Aenigmatarchaeota archaeon]
MEQTIWLIIVIIIAVLVFIIILVIINLSKEQGIRSIGDIFNLSKFLEIIGIKK